MTDFRAAIVSWAESQQGKPYKWGGTGNPGFDCSGLVEEAYKNGAGVGLPHSAAGQQASSVKIPAANLQPADLCFSGKPAYHVVMYVGGDQVVAADHSGTVVRLRTFNPSEWTGGYGTYNVSGTGTTTGIAESVSATVGLNPLDAITGPLKVIEGLFALVSRITEPLTNPTFWNRILMGALGVIAAAIAIEILVKGMGGKSPTRSGLSTTRKVTKAVSKAKAGS